MTNCQGVLENADTPEVLMAVVDVIVYIAREYPHVFGTHFRVWSRIKLYYLNF